MEKLTIEKLRNEALEFCLYYQGHGIPELFGVTDGKAVGTHIEHLFKKWLQEKYTFSNGNSAKGVDLPGKDINTDIKVTSIKQPQSSCPYKDAKQKIYGLGYNILLFVYSKEDKDNLAFMDFVSCAFIESYRTADYTLTSLINEHLKLPKCNTEDLIGLFQDKALPGDDITYKSLAEMVFKSPPAIGYLTISNALQWRLQYKRIVTLTEEVEGIYKLI